MPVITPQSHSCVGVLLMALALCTVPLASASARDAATGTSASAQAGWDTQNTYWRDNYPSRSYYSNSRSYSEYEPAYRYGYDLYSRNRGTAYNDLVDSDLESGWDKARGNSTLGWNDAQMATRDAYNRMHDNRSAGSSPTGSTSVSR